MVLIFVPRKLTLPNEEHPANALLSIIVSSDGQITDFKPVQSLKARLPMDVAFVLLRSTDTRPVQPEKMALPSVRIFAPRVIFFSEVQLINALSITPVTGTAVCATKSPTTRSA